MNTGAMRGGDGALLRSDAVYETGAFSSGDFEEISTAIDTSKTPLSQVAWFTQTSTAFTPVLRDGAIHIRESIMAEVNSLEMKMGTAFVKCMSTQWKASCDPLIERGRKSSGRSQDDNLVTQFL